MRGHRTPISTAVTNHIEMLTQAITKQQQTEILLQQTLNTLGLAVNTLEAVQQLRPIFADIFATEARVGQLKRTTLELVADPKPPRPPQQPKLKATSKKAKAQKKQKVSTGGRWLPMEEIKRRLMLHTRTAVAEGGGLAVSRIAFGSDRARLYQAVDELIKAKQLAWTKLMTGKGKGRRLRRVLVLGPNGNK